MNEPRTSKERIQALRKLFDERHNLSRPPHREWRTAHTEELLRIAEDLQRAADEPPVMLVDGPISASTTVLDVLRSVDNLLEQNRYEPESSTRHQLAIAMSMLRPAEPPPAIRSESVDFLQALFFDSFNVKMSRENCRSILVEALGQPETKSVCTCPPGHCCEKAGAAPSDIRVCRSAGETSEGQP